MDRGTFAEIVERHLAYLCNYARWLARDPHVADDLVQETLARALDHFATFEQGTNGRAWLITILGRLFYDFCKHQRVIKRAHDQLGPPDEAVEDPIVDWPDEWLHDAIAALSKELREVVELCYLQQMRRRDAAAKLGLPEGTIATRLMRARKRLKELLKAMRRNKK